MRCRQTVVLEGLSKNVASVLADSCCQGRLCEQAMGSPTAMLRSCFELAWEEVVSLSLAQRRLQEIQDKKHTSGSLLISLLFRLRQTYDPSQSSAGCEGSIIA